MKIILDLEEPQDEPSPEELVAAAETNLRGIRAAARAIRREVTRLRRLYMRGMLRPSISREGHRRMREEYAARGGTVTACPPGTAEGASVSPFWAIDKGVLVPGVREVEIVQRPDGFFETAEGEESE